MVLEGIIHLANKHQQLKGTALQTPCSRNVQYQASDKQEKLVGFKDKVPFNQQPPWSLCKNIKYVYIEIFGVCSVLRVLISCCTFVCSLRSYNDNV